MTVTEINGHALDHVVPGTASEPVPVVPRRGGVWYLAVPLVLVNACAVWGQAGWAAEHLGHGPVVAFLFAAAVESIGIFLAREAHEAIMADQASGMLRAGSYGVGLLAGWLNYSHFSPDGASTAMAFGALSALSPWLWAIWSRARNRGRLAELGMVDVRAVKLGTARKLLHPLRSYRVVRWAAWAGVTSPQEAVKGWEATQGTPGEAETTDGPSRSARERILELSRVQPALSPAQIAQLAKSSERWVRKVLEP